MSGFALQGHVARVCPRNEVSKRNNECLTRKSLRSQRARGQAGRPAYIPHNMASSVYERSHRDSHRSLLFRLCAASPHKHTPYAALRIPQQRSLHSETPEPISIPSTRVESIFVRARAPQLSTSTHPPTTRIHVHIAVSDPDVASPPTTRAASRPPPCCMPVRMRDSRMRAA